MLRASIACIAALLAAGAACVKPSMRDSYGDADVETRDVFLAYYTELNHQQRKALLENPESYDLLLKAWEIPIKKPDELRRARMIESFSLVPPEGEVTRGTLMEIHAFLAYRDGRRIEVTNDVQWRVLPEPAVMDGSILRYGCMHSDVTVVGSFLGELQASHTYAIRKPVRSIRVSVDESSQVIEASEFVKLKAIARCADGSESDVTCQVEWRADPEVARISGCGYLHLLSARPIQEGAAHVTATYGGVSRQERVPLPRKAF